jgi:hypothetical protein
MVRLPNGMYSLAIEQATFGGDFNGKERVNADIAPGFCGRFNRKPSRVMAELNLRPLRAGVF